jgi:hypothetical protein
VLGGGSERQAQYRDLDELQHHLQHLAEVRLRERRLLRQLCHHGLHGRDFRLGVEERLGRRRRCRCGRRRRGGVSMAGRHGGSV